MDILTAASSYLTLLQNNVLIWFLYAPLLLILADLITGVMVAVKQKIFNWKEFTNFLEVSILPYLLAIIAVFLVYSLSGSAVIANVMIALGMLAHMTAMVSSVVQNLQELNVSPVVVQEVEHLGQNFLQDYAQFASSAPPVAAQRTTPSPLMQNIVPPLNFQQALNVDRQPTLVQPTPIIVPAIPIPVRMSTPPMPAPAIPLPFPTAPVDAEPAMPVGL